MYACTLRFHELCGSAKYVDRTLTDLRNMYRTLVPLLGSFSKPARMIPAESRGFMAKFSTRMALMLLCPGAVTVAVPELMRLVNL